MFFEDVSYFKKRMMEITKEEKYVLHGINIVNDWHKGESFTLQDMAVSVTFSTKLRHWRIRACLKSLLAKGYFKISHCVSCKVKSFKTGEVHGITVTYYFLK